MLQNIHDKAKGWVAYAIVGFIAIPFALFGISSYLSGSSALVAATVNGEEIPARGMQNPQLLNQVIGQTLLEQEAKNNGYRASNQEVYDIISNDPSFQVNGAFDAKTYEFVLGTRRTNKSNYENDLRERISNQQFLRAIDGSSFISPQDLTRYQGLFNQTRNVEMFTLKKSDYQSEVSVSDDEVKSHYNSNTSNYMTTEKVKLSYVKLSQDELAMTVTAEGDALKLFFDDNIDRYVEPEQRKVAHILVKVNGSDEKSDDEAKEKAQSLYEKIKNGSETFDNLAKTNSDDDVAAKKSGELGFVARGDMGKLFDAAAFKLAKDDISEVVKTKLGYEIIKLLDVKAKRQKEFEEVKKEVDELYKKEQAEKLFFDNSEKLQTLAFENEGSLDEAADAVGATVISSEWIERKQSFDPKNLLSSPKIVQAAFSDAVLSEGKNSEMIDVGNGTVYVVRLEEHQMPTAKPLNEVTDIIKSSLADQKLRKIATQKGESVLEKIKQSGDWTALELIGASADKVEKVANVKRVNRKLAQNVVEKIFSMQKPEQGTKTYSNAILSDGDYVLIALSGIKNGESDQTEGLQNNFTRIIGSREQMAMLKALRDQAEIEMFPENLK